MKDIDQLSVKGEAFNMCSESYSCLQQRMVISTAKYVRVWLAVQADMSGYGFEYGSIRQDTVCSTDRYVRIRLKYGKIRQNMAGNPAGYSRVQYSIQQDSNQYGRERKCVWQDMDMTDFYRGFRGPPPNKIRFVLQNEYLAFYSSMEVSDTPQFNALSDNL